MLRMLGESSGICVEVGGHNGISGSTSYLFELLGRRCIVVEPVPYLAAQIRAARSCSVVEAAADSSDGSAEFLIATGGDTLSTLNNRNRVRSRIDEHRGSIESITVATRTLDSILQQHAADAVDVITIDVEGNELAVLHGLTLERWQPRVLIIEDNSLCRDPSVRDYLAQHGYTRFWITVVNHWYCRGDDVTLNRAWRRAVSAVYCRLCRVFSCLFRSGKPE